MATNSDYNNLLNFLEESLKDKKDEIKSLNKYYRDGKSFLRCTYDFLLVSKKDNIIKYMVITFQDLPSPYPDLILEKIKTYASDHELDCDYITWEKYNSYKNPTR